MKIKNIKINNYGNLENKEINLINNINIIYGKNESGKSTLLNYIKNIFYGISKNKNGKEISDYEKYKPWMIENFSGKLNYELDNGENFEIIRDFNKKNPKVYNGNFEEVSKQYNIDKKDGVQFFYEQTRVDEEMFLSTAISMQQEVKLDKQSQSTLIQKLVNLAETGDDEISVKKALDKLNKKQVEEIGTNRTQGKPINVVENRMEELEFVIKDMKAYQNKKIELEQEEKNLKEEILSLEIKNDVIKKVNEINLQNNLEKQKINFNNKIKNELNEKINNSNIEKNNLLKNKKINQEKINNLKNKSEKNNKKIKKQKNNYLISFLIFFIIFILLELINFIYLKNNYLIPFLIFPIYFIYIFTKKYFNKIKKEKIEYENKINMQVEEEKIKNELNIINTKIENIDKQIGEFEKGKINYGNEIKTINIEIDKKLDNLIEELKNKYLGVNINNILDSFNLENSANELECVQDKLNQKKLELNNIIIEKKDIISKLENIVSLREEYENLQGRLEELKKESDIINSTKEYLLKAYEKMKSTITPKFTENLSNNISKISNGKYKKVALNNANDLVVENSFGEYILADRLSVGTIDQLYLSLRLSMIDDISSESMPIILDEAFAYYDDERLENILMFLSQNLENHQLIIFTCTNREKTILNKLGLKFNYVVL